MREGEQNEHKNSFDSLDNAGYSQTVHKKNCKHTITFTLTLMTVDVTLSDFFLPLEWKTRPLSVHLFRETRASSQTDAW